MIVQQTRAGVFLGLRTVFVLTIGFFLAWIRFLFMLIVFAIPLLLLFIATVVGLIVQFNYEHWIQDIKNNPNEAELIGAIANSIIGFLDLCILILGFLIEVWDFLLPALYMVIAAIWNAVIQLVTAIFGTPSLQCILGEIFSAIFETFDHLMVAFQRILTAAERGFTYQIQTRDLNGLRLFMREYVADRSGPDNQTLLLRRTTPNAPTTSVTDDAAPSDPGTDGTCPNSSVFLDKIVPLLEIIIDIGTIIISAIIPVVVVAIRIAIPILIQILPYLLSAVGQVLQALTTNGVFGKWFQVFKDIISLLGPLWDVICPLLAGVIWVICEFSKFFSGLIGDILNSVFGGLFCGVYNLIFNKRENIIHGLDPFFLDTTKADPLNIYLLTPTNPVKYNILFSRSLQDHHNRQYTVTNAAVPHGQHAHYHRETIFRPSNKALRAEDWSAQVARPFHSHTFMGAAAMESTVAFSDTIADSISEHLPSIHRRDIEDTQMTILETYNLLRGSIRTDMDVGEVMGHGLRTNTMARHATTMFTIDDSSAEGSSSGSSSSGLCTGPSQDENTYGPDDDDEIADSTSAGGSQDVSSANLNDNNPVNCKKVWLMCQCTKGTVGQPGESTFHDFEKIAQCSISNLKSLFTNLIAYVEDSAKLVFATFKSMPQILEALWDFAKELEMAIQEFISELITNESALITSMINAAESLKGITPQLNALNYTAYNQMYPQQQGMANTTSAASPDMACPDNATLAEQEVDPRCPIYYCLQKGPPDTCYFSNQNYPGKPAMPPSPSTYEVTYEPLSKEEFLSLAPADRARVRDRYNVRTIRRGAYTQHQKIMGRTEAQALFKMYSTKGAQMFGIHHEAYRRMTDQYEQVTQFMLKLDSMGLFSRAEEFMAMGHSYLYEEGSVLEPEATAPPDTPPPPTPPPPPPSSECRANASNPYKCCTANSTAYECCRGLIGCIPPIPPGLYIKQWTGLDWIGNITEQTCKPFSNGFKEVLFIIRLTIGDFVYWFIQDSPNLYVKGFWQFWVGWMTFPNNKLPPYAFVCFFVNIGGLLLLWLIVTLLYLLYVAFEDWFADVADIIEAFKLQSEVDTQMNNQVALSNMMMASPTNSIIPPKSAGPRTIAARHMLRVLEARASHAE